MTNSYASEMRTRICSAVTREQSAFCAALTAREAFDRYGEDLFLAKCADKAYNNFLL